MNLTGGYHYPRTNGNIQDDELLLVDSTSQQYSLPQMQRKTPPFYLLTPYSVEPPPTGSTNLIVHWGLSRDFDRYVKQPIAPSLSDFLDDIPLAETAQQKAASFAGDAQGGVGTLRSLFTERVIYKEINQLTEQQLSSFSLQREPTLPEMYQIYTSAPKESKPSLIGETNLSLNLINPMPGPSPQVQRVINEQTPRVSPDVKRKAPADVTPGLPVSQVTNPVPGLINRPPTITPTMTNTMNMSASTSNMSYLNDDQDDMNPSKRKSKKTKKEKKT